MRKSDILIPPVCSAELAADSVFYDFGKHAFAVLEVEVDSPVNQTITLAVGEVLEKNHINRDPGYSRVYQEQVIDLSAGRSYVKMTMTHPGYGKGTLSIEPNVAPFRYAEVRGKVKVLQIFQHAYFGYFEDDAADFQSSSPALDRIWDFCKYTMKATTPFGIFIDGDRERQAYEGDAYINQLGYLVCTSDPEMSAATIQRLLDYPTWPTEYFLAMIPIVHDYILYTGDTDLPVKWYPALQKHLLLDGINQDGLLETELLPELMLPGFSDKVFKLRDIVDWPQCERDSYEFGSVNLVPNCWLFMALERMSQIAALLNKDQDAIYYRNCAENLRSAIRKNMLKNGLFVDNPTSEHSALHSCIYPLLWKIAGADEKAPILEQIKSKGMACSVFGAQFLLECCYSYGEADYALELMLSDGKRSWNNMLACGATIAMEAWDDIFKPNQDWNHPWGAAPVNIIVRFLAGIRPLEPGFKKFSVDPQPSTLEHFKLRTPTPHGAIVLEMPQTNKYILTVPQGTCAVYNGQEYLAGTHTLPNKDM